MLSINTLSGTGSGLSEYFEVEAGDKNYWAKEAKESTQWFGRGSEELGLRGPVDQQQFVRIMDRNLPGVGQLPAGQGGARRMGYDLTFSAPKSVSLQALIGDDARVLKAHQDAVRDALLHIEKNILTAQAKTNGRVWHEQSGNMTAAIFDHQTSRANDPQLHSHCVVANITKTQDGRWRALDGGEFYKAKMASGAHYRSVLAENLQKLGYEIKVTNKAQGTFELKGFKRAQLDRFSTRRGQIVESLNASGRKGGKAAEIAALSTRQKKSKLSTENKAELRAEWKARAEGAGIKLAIPGKVKELSAGARATAADRSMKQAVSSLLKSGKPIKVNTLEARAIAGALGKASPADVRAAIQSAQNRGLLVKQGRMIQPTEKMKTILLTQKLGKKIGGHIARRSVNTAIKAFLPPPLKAVFTLGKVLTAKPKSFEKGHGLSR